MIEQLLILIACAFLLSVLIMWELKWKVKGLAAKLAALESMFEYEQLRRMDLARLVHDQEKKSNDRNGFELKLSNRLGVLEREALRVTGTTETVEAGHGPGMDRPSSPKEADGNS